VSLAFALRGDFPWKRVPGYIIAQLVGATLACLFLLAVFGNIQHLGATLPGPGYHDWQAFLMEIALTGVLLSLILGTASAAQNVGAIGAVVHPRGPAPASRHRSRPVDTDVRHR
jgi:aquaporin Z